MVAASDAVSRAGLAVTDMKFFSARSNLPSDVCRREVERADVYVLIAGFRYGSTVRDRPDLSYTELEYAQARALGRPCLVFLLDERGVVPLPATHIRDLENGHRQEAFRQRLMADTTVTRIATPGDLEVQLHHALVKLREELEDDRRGGRDSRAPDRAGPFMAPQLPEPHVGRRDLSARIIAQLDGPVPRTICLWGEAGSGKRTLAISVCHQVRDHFPGGVLWATLGDQVTASDSLVAKINDLAATLDGKRPQFTGTEAAGAHLGRLLESDRRLLVVDDVRQADHLTPFLQARCVRLVTTRDRSLVPEDAIAVPVGPMDDRETLELLEYGLDAPGLPELVELSKRTRGIPSVVRDARRAVRYRKELGATIDLAAAYVDACLAKGGLAALDSPVGLATLTMLRDGRPDRLEHYLRLAVFPEDVDIPLVTLSRYWGMPEPEAERLSRELAELELVEHRGAAGLRLHGVLRVATPRLAACHRRLLEVPRALLPTDGEQTAWWAMSSDEPYLWRHLAHHLRGAGEDGGPETAELETLLVDPRWMAAQTLQLAGPTGHVLRGHGGRVRAVAISPDASWLASADVLGTIRIWDMVDGSHRSTLVGHSGAVNGLAISPDSAWLASASADKTVRIWNVASGTYRTLFGHADGVNAVAFSPDGSWLATAGMDATVRLWNAADGSNRATAHGHSGPSRAVAISPTDPLLVSTGDDWIMLRRSSDGAPLNNLARWSGVMQWSVAFAPDGTWVACMGRGGAVLLLNVNGTERARLNGHSGAVNAIAVAPAGTWLASAGRDGTIRLWSAPEAAQRAALTGHDGPVNAIAISPGGSWLASAGDDGTVRLWRVPAAVAAP